jgi:Sec-independent protein translocase protein TatA
MVVVAVALLLLGPDKLPEVAHKLGSSWRALKRLQEKVEAEVREAIPDLPSSGDLVRIARSPVNMLNQLATMAEARDAAAAQAGPEADENPVSDDEPVATAPSPPETASSPTPLAVRSDYAPLPPDPSLN